MGFRNRFFQSDKLASLARPCLLVLSVLLSSLVLVGCEGASSTSTDEITEGIVNQPTIAESVNFTDNSYKLITLTGYEQSALQVYWPTDSVMPVILQADLQLLIPQINTIFRQQNFAFSQLTKEAVALRYKKLIFNPITPATGVGKLDFSFASDGKIIVMLDVDALLGDDNTKALLSSELTQIIYQSERLNYQSESSVFDRLVSRGLALHFLKKNLPANEITFSVDIEESELSTVLAQVKSGLVDGVLIENLFTQNLLSEQGKANALGYYLVRQHFSYYSGSNASNCFSLASRLFLPWLEGENSATRKTDQYVRTGNVAEQISVEALARQASLYLGSYFIEGLNHEKLIALTFDDGPSQYTTQILDVLAQAQVPASFFWQGQNLANYQGVVERSIAAGHTVANHSWDHANGMSYSSDELWQQQVVTTNDEFKQLFNISPRFYRPPYGEISDQQIEYLASKGMKVMLWSVDSRDWNPELNSIDKIESELINNQHEEVITLMHDAGGNRQNTVDALPAIIAHYKSQGYRFVNLETLLGISDKH